MSCCPSIADARFYFVRCVAAATAALAFVSAFLVGCDGARQGGAGWDMGAMFAEHKEAPSGEEWTILCLEAHDLNHARNAKDLARALRQVRQLDGAKVRVEHNESVSRVFYGSYRRRLDPAEGKETFGPQVQRDLDLIRSLSAGRAHPFAAARLVPGPSETSADPGQPEWEIHHCPGTYTLQVGVFYNTPSFDQRKETAVRWVEELRNEGIEAYYHHGQVRSSVTVGSFGEEDVIRQRVGPRFSSSGVRIRYSDRVESLRRQERFKYNLENGHKIKRVLGATEGQTEEVYQRSFLIPVPKKKTPMPLR